MVNFGPFLQTTGGACAPLAAPIAKSLYPQRNLSWIQAKFNTYTKVVLFFLFSIYCTTFVANNAGFC